MLQIGLLADYGLVIVCNLVDSQELLTTREIAQRTAIPLATVRKILKLLVDATVISSYRGSRGGYKLTQSADSTSIADVIQAIDGPIELTKCLQSQNKGVCLLRESCTLKQKWCELNQRITAMLQSVSVRDIATGEKHLL
ncbi:MAG: SUF system Fe-S cluster assembly regulator [Halieaceae bacterium]|jgi:FeS assembly SUF system regulator|nr:SUF system Fe-S cluster assembly regulator [Halieaceae bacterium]